MIFLVNILTLFFFLIIFSFFFMSADLLLGLPLLWLEPRDVETAPSPFFFPMS